MDFEKSSNTDIVIDNEFNDWEQQNIFSDKVFDQNNNTNIDITRYSISTTQKGLAFFVEVYGDIFHGIPKESDYYPDNVCIFIDLDSDKKTGYELNNLGADYYLDLRGAKGIITQQKLFKYYTNEASHNDDWLGWEYQSNAAVGIDEFRLECEIYLPSDYDCTSTEAMIITQDYYGNLDYSDNIINPNNGILTFNVKSSLPDLILAGEGFCNAMEIEILSQSSGSEKMYINKLILEQLGNANDDVIELLEFSLPDRDTIISKNKFRNRIYEIELDPPFIVLPNKKSSISIKIDISPEISSGSTFGMELKHIGAMNATVTINQLNQILSYIEKIPEKITIDGAFSDWGEIEKYPDDDFDKIINPDLNIQEFSLVSEDGKLNFYFNIEGNLLSAMDLPIKLIPINDKLIHKQSNDKDEKNRIKNEGLELLPQELVTKDRLHIFLDTDRDMSTGYRPSWLKLGAEHMIQITGRDGEIINHALYKYSNVGTLNFGSNATNETWSWEFMAFVPTAKDKTQLETCVFYNILEFNLEKGVNVCYVLSNWDSSITDSTEKLNIEFSYEAHSPSSFSSNHEMYIKLPNRHHSTRAGNDDVLINEVMFDVSGGPYDGEFAYKKKITINSSMVAGDLTNFPLLINITDNDLQAKARADGYDILFTASDMEIKLDHEIEGYNSSSGELIAWVRIPELNSTVDTEIYMYYGNSNSSDQSNPTSVWDVNYTGIWHMCETPIIDSYALDSTTNGNNANFEPSMTSSDQVKGWIYGGLDFDGGNDYINCGNDVSLNITSEITIDAWIYSRDLSGYDTVINKASGVNSVNYYLDTNNDEANFGFYNGVWREHETNQANLLTSNWYHIAAVYDDVNNYVRIYVNGKEELNTPSGNSLILNNGELWIGGCVYASEWWNGILDEVRISNIVRSPEWILTQYYNANSSDLFYSIDLEEVISKPNWVQPSNGYNWLNRKQITIDSSQVTGDLIDFPVLINLIDPDLSNKAKSNGYDIIFTDSDGKTKLDHEIESYNDTTGELIAWVEIPYLSSSTDTVIFMYYGNPDAQDQQNPTGVWDSNYTGVWHLKEIPTGITGDIKDSTLNNNNGTTEGSMSAINSVEAKIGKGLEFDEINDMIRIKNSTSLNSTDTTATIQLWLWWDNASDGDHQIVMSSSNRFTVGANDGYEWATQGSGNHFYYPWGGHNSNYNLGPNPFTNQTWHHLVVTHNYSSKGVNIYIDGNAMFFSTENVPTFWTQLALPDDWLWGGNPDRATRYFDGMFDEIRVSNIDRSLEWIQTEFNNQNSTSSFYSVGSEESFANYEWIELYNADISAVDLTGWILSDNDGNTFNLSGAGIIPSSGYLVCHFGQVGINSSSDVYGHIISGNTIQKAMLDKIDDVALINSTGTIVDYVAWGDDPGSDDDAAVIVGEWTDGVYIDTSSLLIDETLGRDKDSTDNNGPSDWENASTNQADPFGINATNQTAGARNKDYIIPEFDILAIPIIFIALIILFIDRYYKPNSNLKSSSDDKNIRIKKKR